MADKTSQILQKIDAIDWQNVGLPKAADWFRDMLSPDKDLVLAACHDLEEEIHTGAPRPEEYPTFERLLSGRDWIVTVPVLISLAELSQIQSCVVQYLDDLAMIAIYHLEDFPSSPNVKKCHELVSAVAKGKALYSEIAESGATYYAQSVAKQLLKDFAYYDSVTKKA